MLNDIVRKENFVLDSHCDTPTMLLEGIDLGVRQKRGHVDFVRAREGGVDGMFFAIYSPPGLTEEEATVHAVKLISKCYDAVDSNSTVAAFAFSPEEAFENRKRGLISVFLGMENGTPIQDDLAYLRLYYRFGIRYLTLCHNRHNRICDSCMPASSEWGGLSPFGREVVSECNRLGILLDCSHASDGTFYDLLNCSATPVFASHSSCRALCEHPRNMSDGMIRDLASAGGVIQINFYPKFIDSDFSMDGKFRKLSEEGEHWQDLYRSDLYNVEYRDNYWRIMDELATYPTPSVKRVVDHIDHAVGIAGPDHVGLGSDFDGIEVAPEGLRDISMYGNIAAELRERGYRESDIRGIMGGNFLRVMHQAQKSARSSEG